MCKKFTPSEIQAPILGWVSTFGEKIKFQVRENNLITKFVKYRPRPTDLNSARFGFRNTI